MNRTQPQVARIEITDSQLDQLAELVAKKIVARQQPERPISREALAAHFAVSPSTVDRWKKRKLIPFFMLDQTLRFYLSDVEAALRRHGDSQPKLHGRFQRDATRKGSTRGAIRVGRDTETWRVSILE